MTTIDLTKVAELGVDTEEGLAYCADDLEFYGEVLEEFISEGTAKADELRQFFAAQDWANYAIRAHTVKTISRTIGARQLSEHARVLEFAAKEGDSAVIRAEHEPFTAELGTLIAGLEEVVR
jgi:HPt (histidine-containing phosphotransfer) domain-containing protein